MNPVVELPNKASIKLPGAYVLMHVLTKKMYVGSTADLRNRKSKHEMDLRNRLHYSDDLQLAYDADSEIEFIFYIAKDREEAFDFEQALLDQWFETGTLFNKAKDARASRKGAVLSVEQLEKLRESRKEWNNSDEFKQLMSRVHKGKVYSEATRKKISDAAKAQGRGVTVDGVEYQSVQACAKAHGISVQTVYVRIRSENSRYSDWTYTE